MEQGSTREWLAVGVAGTEREGLAEDVAQVLEWVEATGVDLAESLDGETPESLGLAEEVLEVMALIPRLAGAAITAGDAYALARALAVGVLVLQSAREDVADVEAVVEGWGGADALHPGEPVG